MKVGGILGAEIDRLEIVVESEAGKASKSLDKLEKQINSIASSLDKLGGLSGKIGGLGGGDASGLVKVDKRMGEVQKKIAAINNKKISPSVDSSDFKYAAKSANELQKKFQNIGKDFNVSDMGFTQLQKQIGSMESALDKAYVKMDKTLSLSEGENISGKAWYALQYDIAKYGNQLDIAKSKLAEFSSMQSQIKITRMSDVSSGSVGNSLPKTKELLSQPEFDADAMRMTFGAGTEHLRNMNDIMQQFGGSAQQAGSALNNFEESINTEKLETYETQIKKLKAELASLGKQGYAQNTSEYDAVARNLQKVILEKRQYDKATKAAAQSDMGHSAQIGRQSSKLKQVGSVLGEIGSKLSKAFGMIKAGAKKAVSGIAAFGRSVRSVAKVLVSPISALSRFKNSLLGVQKEARRGITLGGVFGMMALRSALSQILRAIRSGIAEGSNNLVQYSNAYNKSISSIVSALLTLKNAWAVAFAPIVNVVAPYLSAFIEMISSALNAVGKFFAALTGKSSVVQAVRVTKDYGASLAGVSNSGSDAADSLGSAGKAAKELKKTVLGFDRLNVLNAQDDNTSSSGSGGSGGGVDVGDVAIGDMFETVDVDGAVADFAKKLRKAFLAEDWVGLGKIIGEGINSAFEKLDSMIRWDNVGAKITKAVNAITTTLNSLVNTINWGLIGRTIGDGVNTVVNTLNLFITGFNWRNLGASFATGINSIFNTVNWGNLGALIGSKFMIIWNTLYGLVTGLDYSMIGRSLAKGVTGIFNSIDFGTITTTLATGINGLATIIINFAKNVDWGNIASQISSGLNNMIKSVNWGDVGRAISELFRITLGTLADVVKQVDWTALGRAVGTMLSSIDWKGVISSAFTIIKEVIFGLIEGLSETTGGKVVLAIAAIAGLFKLGSVATSALNGIQNVLQVWGGLSTGISGSGVGIGSALSGIGSLFSTKLLPAIGSAVSGGISALGGLLSAIGPAGWIALGIAAGVILIIANWDKIKDAAGKVKDWVVEKWSALKERASEIWDGIKTKVSGVWDNLKTAASEKFESMKATISEKWDSVKSATSSVWSTIKTNVSSNWDVIKSTASSVFSKIGSTVKDAWSGTEKNTSNSWTTTSKTMTTFLNSMDSTTKSKLNSIKNTVSSSMSSASTVYNNAWKNMGSASTSAISSMVASVGAKMSQMKGSIISSMNSIVSSYKSQLSQMPSATTTALNSVVGTFISLPNKVSSAVSGMYSVGRNAAQQFANGFRSVYIPTPHISIGSYTRHSVGTSSVSTPNFRVNWYKSGGFPTAGELFVANEAGPEMVGKMGNRNVVANNNQITTGIKNAVVEGMVEVAMRTASMQGGSSKIQPVEIPLIVGKEELARAIYDGFESLVDKGVIKLNLI